MEYDAIFMIGPQGSGKGTQGKRLAEKLGFFFWEMGGVLRGILKEHTPLAEKVSVINQGILLTDDLIIEVLKEKLNAIPASQGIIFDGVPRRLGQAEFLLNFLHERGKSKFVTLALDLPKEETFARLSLRAQKEGRADDTPEAIESRLRQYEEAIQPTLDYLKQKTHFVSIDGRPPMEEVAQAIDTALHIA